MENREKLSVSTLNKLGFVNDVEGCFGFLEAGALHVITIRCWLATRRVPLSSGFFLTSIPCFLREHRRLIGLRSSWFLFRPLLRGFSSAVRRKLISCGSVFPSIAFRRWFLGFDRGSIGCGSVVSRELFCPGGFVFYGSQQQQQRCQHPAGTFDTVEYEDLGRGVGRVGSAGRARKYSGCGW